MMLGFLNSAARVGNKTLRIASSILAMLMLVFASYSILDTWYTERMAFSNWELVAYRPVSGDGTLSREMFDELSKINPDVVGWITVYGTNIDYPILQGPDDLYYVNRDIYGNSTLSGSIYLQSANSSDFSDEFNLLYGHHFDNGAMFGDVAKYTDPDFFDGHREGELITKDGICYLNFFVCIETDAYDSNIYGVTTIRDKMEDELLPTARKQVFFPLQVKGTSLDGDDEDEDPLGKGRPDHDWLLALSTCDDAETDGRVVIIADVTEGEESRTPSSGTASTGELRPGEGKWAVLNLMCVVFTLCCIVPFCMRYVNFRKEQIKTAEILGTVGVILASVVSLLLFRLTENMRSPMTLRDYWTPFMIFIFASALLVTALTDRKKKQRAQED
ncbi:MAG TPA: hypothetical protein DCW41_02290 [Clostridiales bacterium]|nr:hypothetical protein [Clostridiales bacterium]